MRCLIPKHLVEVRIRQEKSSVCIRSLVLARLLLGSYETVPWFFCCTGRRGLSGRWLECNENHLP